MTGCAVPVPVPVLTPATTSPAVEQCAPLDPAWTTLPDAPCFHASRTAVNEVTLNWRVKNAGAEVYIYDDAGTSLEDVGPQPAACPDAPGQACSATVPVAGGGFYRWLIRVADGRDNVIHVPAALALPEELSAIEVDGDGFVDVLAGTSRLLQWRRNGGNSAADPGITRSWVEMQEPGRLRWTRLDDSADPASAGTIEVPDSLLRERGDVGYRFRECQAIRDDNSRFCLEPVTANLHVSSDRFLNWNTLYTEAGEALSLSFTTLAGDERRLVSSTLLPQAGTRGYAATREDSVLIPGDRLTAGRHVISLRSCLHDTDTCSAPDTLSIVVGAPVSWELGRDYRKDFQQAIAHPVRGAGLPLAITYGPFGGIWLINEFSTSIEHISPTGTVKSFTLPLGRHPATDSSAQKATRPFAMPLPQDRFAPASFSALAERATRVGSTLWFTQGGSPSRATINNHSRIIAFDPSRATKLATPFDDRFCVYNVPSDDEEPHGNNAVIGLTWAKGRIWIGESRGIWGQETSVISSFMPDPGSCDNLLVFEKPGALANQRLRYCTVGGSPERDGCMKKRVLDDQPRGLKIAQLATDPTDDIIWFTDAHGRYLGKMHTDDQQAVQLYPFAEIHADLGVFAGFTWNLAVDDEAVYIAEYLTRHILRFDKATSTFHEIEVPGLTSQVTLHSLDIDSKTRRLWFTLSNDPLFPTDRNASTTGYVDLDSWSDHIDEPGNGAPISGVVYAGLGSPGATGHPAQPHQNFTGIAVDPTSGSVALSSFHRRQVIELKPPVPSGEN